MKYKIGQKVVAKYSSDFDKGEILKIIEVDNYDNTTPYYCKNNKGKHYWQYESDLEPLKEEQQMTFEEKLEKFKSGKYVLNTPTQEIYDKLMVELEKRGYVCFGGKKLTDINGEAQYEYGSSLCIREYSDKRILYADIDFYEKNYKILELSLSDFQSTPPTTIVITSDNHHKITAESNGITAEAKCNPEDKFSITKGTHMALQRLLDKTKETAKEDNGFYVGDIVEILHSDYKFTIDVIGLQGIITEVGTTWVKVTFPVHVHKEKDSWVYCNDEVKLIRRAPKDTN